MDQHTERPFNPLDKLQLAESVVGAMLERGLQPLPPPRFGGAGIYAIYYFGAFPAYAPIAPSGAMAGQEIPIYVGKAVPAGSRQGGMGLGLKPNTALFSRLSQHVRSIEAVSNLALPDFACRYLVVDDIWIPLGEALLIERYRPLWNRGIDGFGNHDQGATRRQAKRSAWDTLHPGRPWAGSFQPHGQTVEAILARIAEAFEHPERVPPPLDSGAQDDGSVV